MEVCSALPVYVKVFLANLLLTRFHRSMTRPFFTKERISHFEMFDFNADRALQQAKTRLADGFPIDIQVSSYA